MAVGARFPLGGAVELEYGVDADLPHSLRDGSPQVTDSNFAGAGRRKSPEAVPRQSVEQGTDLKQSRLGWSQPPNITCKREIIVALPIGLEPTLHVRATATRVSDETAMI
jgi:hypothetical protein